MSILNVNRIQPVGSGQTVTINAANISAGSATVTAGTFSGNLSGNVTGGVTITSGTISGVSTAGITTAYIGSVNDGPISGARNRIINGDMRIDQRNAGASVNVTTSSNTYPVDRFSFEQGGLSSNAGSIQRVADAPVGFTSSVKYTAGSSTFSIATGWGGFHQRIEGFNVSDLKWGTSSASPVTLSFWVKASVAGLYTVNMTHYDGVQERWNNITYTINSTDTWEYKTMTFIGDTSRGIVDDNGTNGWMRVYWHLGDGGGASTTTSFNTWFNGAAANRGASGTTNIMGTAGRTWQITGIQLEAGTVATPFERRSYSQELSLCHRYFHRMNTGRFVMGYKRHDTECAWFYQSPVPMRTSPSPTLNSGGNFTNFQSSFGTTQSNPTVYEYSTNTGNGVMGCSSTWASTHTYIPSWEAFNISFSAEL